MVEPTVRAHTLLAQPNSDRSNSGRKEKVKLPCGKERVGLEEVRVGLLIGRKALDSTLSSRTAEGEPPQTWEQ